MGRACKTCTSRDRQVIEAQMLAGRRIDDIGADFSISRSSLYGHRKRCLSASILRDLRASQDVGTVDLIEALADALGDVTAARQAALMAGRTNDVVRAASAAVATVSALCDRIGLDSTEVVRELREADDLARAIGAAVRDDPVLAAPLCTHLRARGRHDMATALQRVADLAQPDVTERTPA